MIDHFGEMMHAMFSEPEWFQQQLDEAERIIKAKEREGDVDIEQWADRLASDVSNAND